MFEPVRFAETPGVAAGREAIAKVTGRSEVAGIACLVCRVLDGDPGPVWIHLGGDLWFAPLGAEPPAGCQVWRGVWQDGWVRP